MREFVFLLPFILSSTLAQAQPSKYMCEIACGESSVIVSAKARIPTSGFNGCKSHDLILIEGSVTYIPDATAADPRGRPVASSTITVLDEDEVKNAKPVRGTIAAHTSINANTGSVEDFYTIDGDVSIECKMVDPKKPNFTMKALLALRPKPAGDTAKQESENGGAKNLPANPNIICPNGTAWSYYYYGCVGYVGGQYYSLPFNGYYQQYQQYLESLGIPKQQAVP